MVTATFENDPKIHAGYLSDLSWRIGRNRATTRFSQMRSIDVFISEDLGVEIQNNILFEMKTGLSSFFKK